MQDAWNQDLFDQDLISLILHVWHFSYEIYRLIFQDMDLAVIQID